MDSTRMGDDRDSLIARLEQNRATQFLHSFLQRWSLIYLPSGLGLNFTICFCWLDCGRNDGGLFSRWGHEKRRGFLLAFSLESLLQGIQRPYQEDMQAVLWRGPAARGQGFLPTASTDLPGRKWEEDKGSWWQVEEWWARTSEEGWCKTVTVTFGTPRLPFRSLFNSGCPRPQALYKNPFSSPLFTWGLRDDRLKY